MCWPPGLAGLPEMAEGRRKVPRGSGWPRCGVERGAECRPIDNIIILIFKGIA